MVVALYIFVDDDFNTPIYAEPGRQDLEPEVYTAICEAANDALEGDRSNAGTHTDLEEMRLGWRLVSRIGLTFVCVVTDDINAPDLDIYLKALQKQYLDEVDSPRDPERDGVEDVVVDVIPPWEE